MWTKFVNWLGFETKAQKAEAERIRREFRRVADEAMARHRAARAVIKSTGVPIRRPQPIKPSKSTQQVRRERYGVSQDEGYLTPGFNSYYTPLIMDTGGYDYDYMETSFPNVPSSSDSAPTYSEPSSSSSYDPPASSSSSYDSPASSSSSYDPPSSSSYDSGSSSSYDSGSSGGGSFGE